jgi:hypothetical protein
VLLLLPPLVGLGHRLVAGRMPRTETHWRSSPRGLDLLSYVVPNPNHAWFGGLTRPWFMPDRPDAFPEFVGSFSIVAFAVIACAAYRGLLPRLWVAFTVFFAALSLGPFVHVAGINSYMIGPWALLRYLPVVGLARSPSRFAIVTVLGLSLLFAFALEALWRRYRPPLTVAVVLFALLAFELSPNPRLLVSAAVPDVYRAIATGSEEAGTLLELPTGIRDGTSSVGDFRATSLYYQTVHRRPLVGGYLSRVSQWRRQENERSPMMRTLLALSEGQEVAPAWMIEARHSREAFLRRACVKFVTVDRSRMSRAFEAAAVDVLGLKEIRTYERYGLFAPGEAPQCD